MMEYIVRTEPRGTIARVGVISDTRRRLEYPTPVTSPAIRTTLESRALLRLLKDGARTPALFIPLSRRKEVKGVLGSVIDSTRTTLDGFVGSSDRPMIIPDPESEAFTLPCRARDNFRDDGYSPIPTQAEELFGSVLRVSPKQFGHREYGKAWDETASKVGIASLGEWYERITHEAGSSVYLAPSPMIRASTQSVDRAFRVSWKLVDVATESFDASGPHFLVHSELFRNDSFATAARLAFLARLQSEYATITPRRLPYLSLKVYQNGTDLAWGPGASQCRRNFSEFVGNVSHHIRAMGGALILQNLGTWSLGGLDSGADVVSFRGDARPLQIDPVWRRAPKVAGRRRTLTKTAKHRDVEPFDPHALCDGSLQQYKSTWSAGVTAFSSSPHVEPEPFWEWEWEKQFEYRTRQIIDGLVELGREYRQDLQGEVPIGEAVRSRIQRMRDQDALTDLCPSAG